MQPSDVTSPEVTSETQHTHTPSTDNISQPENIVNSNDMQSDIELSQNIPTHLKNTVENIKKRTGLDVVLGRRYNADGSIDNGFRGYFDGEKIVVSENATKRDIFNTVVLHELTHSIEGTNQYSEIEKYIIDKKYGGDTERFNNDIANKIEEYKQRNASLDDRGAKAEIIASNVEEYIFADDIRSIVEQDYTFGQKVYDFITELIYKIKNKYGTAVDIDHLKNAQRKYRQALDEVRKNGTISIKGNEYSIFDTFYNEYDKWIKNGANYNITLTVGRTSNALKSIGIDDKEIKWDTGKIKKIKKDHNLNDKIIKQVPQIIENPVIIMDSLQKGSRLTVLGEVYDLNNKPVLAVLELEPTNNKGEIILDEIKIASAYGKDNVQNLINNSRILYIDGNKKRINNWLTHNRLQLPLGQTNNQFFNDIVPQNKTIVNNNYMQNDDNNATEQKTDFEIAYEKALEKKKQGNGQYSFATEQNPETSKFVDESGNEYENVAPEAEEFGVRILEGKDNTGKDILEIDVDNPDIDSVISSEEYKRLIENAFDIKEVRGNTLTAERAFEKAFGKNYESFRKVVYDNLDKSKLQYMNVLDYLTIWMSFTTAPFESL